MATAESKDAKVFIEAEEARAFLVEGARRIFQTVSVTYGPRGRNMPIEKSYGKFMLTRDGVTVARETYFDERAVNIGTQALYEASEVTNRIAGDGTSATVILGYHLMKRGQQAIASGIHEMEVKEMLLADREILLKKLETMAKKPTNKQLQEVATVSSGEATLGQLISEALIHVGPDGGIITERAYTTDIERVYEEGYYLQSGFMALQEGKKELADAHVLVISRTLNGGTEVLEILNHVAEAVGAKPGQPMRLVFIGNIEGDAYNTIVANIQAHNIDAIVIKTPPQFGEMGKELLEDVAAYCRCEPISDTTALDIIDGKYVGKIHRIKANKSESTLFADSLGKMAELRIDYIKSQLKEEITPAIAEKLRDRLSKLEGKIAIFKIGGATDTTKEEREFRVEDAINATRAAYTDGVVPGGGVTFLELSTLPISDMYGKALQDTFKQLLINANLPAELKLHEAMGANAGMGYNLKERDGKLVDMVKAGILDPKMVIEQVVINATQAAADILTAGGSIVFKDKDAK